MHPVLIAGAGPGHPGYITVRALEAIRGADVLLYDHLVHPALVAESSESAERISVGKFGGKGGTSQEEILRLLEKKARAGKRVVRLKGGDPLVFGRGGEEAMFCAARGIPFEIIPGITAAVGAAATAGIPLTHRGVSGSLHVATGHEDASKAGGAVNWASIARAGGTMAIYMAGKSLADVARRLVRAGRPAKTPAATIEWATLPRQRVVVSTLGRLAADAETARLEPPVLVLAGDVVRLRASIDWFSRRPLSGRIVLVTRATAFAGTLARALEAQGAWAVECPSIRIEEIRPNPSLARALGRPGRFSWVVFASPKAAHLFFEGLRANGLDARALAGVRIAAIGSETAKRLAEGGLRPDLVPVRHTSEGLLAEFPKPPRGTRKRPARCGAGRPSILLPRGEEGTDVLPKGLAALGWGLVCVSLYRTHPVRGLPEEARRMLKDDRADAVLFASGSAARAFAKNLRAAGIRRLPPRIRTISMGPATSAAMRAAGLRIDAESDVQSIPGLVETLEKALKA